MPPSTFVRRCAPLLAVVLAPAAQAHHAMDGQLPATLWQGLLSGLAHPLIELDHLLFLLGAAVLVAVLRVPAGSARLLLGLFAGAGMVGTLLHVQRITLPAVELGVALSLLAVAIALLRAALAVRLAVALALAGGLLHGYAYGEAIVGAETTPLGAYLLGLLLVQALLLVAVHAAWGFAGAQAATWLPLLRRGLSLLLGLAGAWALGLTF